MLHSRSLRPKHLPREDRPQAPLRRLERTPNYGGATGAAVPKGPKAKPGKRAPNAEERRWMDAIVGHGCIACRLDGLGHVEPCVHHILRGGQRMGHLYTLPLCPAHHQHDTASGLIARHPYRTRFIERYGSEEELLERLRQQLGVARG